MTILPIRSLRSLGLGLLCMALLGAPAALAQTTSPYQVFAFNDLGMHCYDADFSRFAVLPMFNVLHAQVVQKGTRPLLLDSTQVRVTYQAVADPTGSINRTSANSATVFKTNFWTYVQSLFGVSLPVNVGLLGYRMPLNAPQLFKTYDPAMKWFGAEGIPITAIDDAGKRNTLPLMRVVARDKASNALLSYLDTVVPVSDEMNCAACHIRGGMAANAATTARHGITTPWSANPNLQIQVKENVLILHDAIEKTAMLAAAQAGKPTLCASCHYSAALDLAHAGPTGAQVGKLFMSYAMHGRHGKTIDNTLPDATHPAIVNGTNTNACYLCHPGRLTKCLRGAMTSPAANEGCQNCHGGMLALSGIYNLKTTGKPRQPWLEEPKCQACHTGDAMSHRGAALILKTAYAFNDPAATPILATNKRFAENDNKLFRFSTGHGGMACEACHGSPHAEWPTRAGTNDNIAATRIQGHTGPIIECSVCHIQPQPLTTSGPHGLHNVNSPDWNLRHSGFAAGDPNYCRACHGLHGEGTVLGKVAATRILQTDDQGPITIPKGTPINCSMCHSNKL